MSETFNINCFAFQLGVIEYWFISHVITRQWFPGLALFNQIFKLKSLMNFQVSVERTKCIVYENVVASA